MRSLGKIMNKIEQILKRLYENMGFKKDTEFCDKYDIKANTLSTWKKRDKVPYELLEEISQNENISLDWLLTGFSKDDQELIDEMIKYFNVPSLEAIAVELKYGEKEADIWRKKGIPRSVAKKFNLRMMNDEAIKQADKEIKQEQEGNYSIDLLSIKAGAGRGIYNYEIEVVDKIVVDSIFFKHKPDPSKIKIITGEGDSMEPNIKDGAYVIIDESKADKIDGIYALQLDGQLLIKRLQFKLDGSIKIISDNAKYEAETYNPNDTQVLCRIIGRKVLTIQ